MVIYTFSVAKGIDKNEVHYKKGGGLLAEIGHHILGRFAKKGKNRMWVGR